MVARRRYCALQGMRTVTAQAHAKGVRAREEARWCVHDDQRGVRVWGACAQRHGVNGCSPGRLRAGRAQGEVHLDQPARSTDIRQPTLAGSGSGASAASARSSASLLARHPDSLDMREAPYSA